MADGGSNLSRLQSVSITSDGVSDFECFTCKNEGIYAEGVAFCVDCREYLCSKCLVFHRRVTALKQHNVLEGKDALEEASKYLQTGTDNERCDLHTGKYVDFYCGSHGEVICADCRILQHLSCVDVTDIASETKRNKWTRDGAISELTEVQELIAAFNEVETHVDKHSLEHEGYIQKCRQQVNNTRRKLTNALNELESKMYKDLEDEENRFASSSSEVKTTIEATVVALEKAADNLTSVQSLGDDRQTFIAAKKARQKPLTDILQNVYRHSQKPVNVRFEPDQLLTDILESLERFGRLTIDGVTLHACINDQPGIGTGHQHMVVVKDKKALKIGEFSVKEEDDENKCCITGAQFLLDGSLIITDIKNRKVKLLNDKFNLQSSIDLSTDPCDIAIINEQVAVVTLPRENTLQFLNVTPQLQMTSQVTTTHKCRGIVYHGNRLYSSCVVNGVIAVMVFNRHGREVSTVTTNVKGKEPNHIAIDRRGLLYISDLQDDLVMCITEQGQLVYTYKHADLQSPTGLLIDDDFNVYVCVEHAHTVHVIGADGTKCQSALDWLGGESLTSTSMSLAYRQRDATLVVGMYSNALSVFQF